MQVAIRAPCCKKWFDCAECHAEQSDHRLAKTNEMTFLCKGCKKAFRKDMTAYEESDEYCPHCDNHYVGTDAIPPAKVTEILFPFQVIEAKTPRQVVEVEAEDVRKDARYGLNGTLIYFTASHLSCNRIIKDLRLKSTRSGGDDIDDFLAEHLE